MRGKTAQRLKFAAQIICVFSVIWLVREYLDYRDKLVWGDDFPNGIPRWETECENGRAPVRLLDGTPDCLTHEQWESFLDMLAAERERPEFP
jgi:hypothetical protein